LSKFDVRRALVAAAVLLTGCAVGPDFKSPDAPQTTRFTPSPMPTSTVGAAVVAGDVQTLHDGGTMH
jgi:hypothetical protein